MSLQNAFFVLLQSGQTGERLRVVRLFVGGLSRKALLFVEREVLESFFAADAPSNGNKLVGRVEFFLPVVVGQRMQTCLFSVVVCPPNMETKDIYYCWRKKGVYRRVLAVLV